MARSRAVAGLLVSAAFALACGGSVNEPGNGKGPIQFTNVAPPPGGVAQFTVLPVAIAPGLTLTALGNLSPPGHVLPTDHVYFYDWDLSRGNGFGTDTRAVYMPATGAAFLILSTTGSLDSKVMFRATDDFYFYLDHVVLSSPIAVGQIIQAGTQIGATAQGSTLDLGAFDESVSHTGFVNPARYSEQSLHYVSPWEYFTPALRAQIAPHMYRAASAPDSDGRIDFGVAGKLVGDWFLQGMPVDSSWQPFGWTRTIAFVYDYFDPSLVRISVGGTIGPAGVWAIDPAAPRPETVSVASGLVRYTLYSPFDAGFPPTGYLLVQMLDDSTIQVELFGPSATPPSQFDAKTFTFVR